MFRFHLTPTAYVLIGRPSAAWPAPAPPAPNKGGHRERAINFVNAAISETEAGIAYAGN